jgi:hypothetical protein
VAIYGVEEDGAVPYIVMQLVDGMSLQDLIDRKGALSLKEILRIGTQIAWGLAAAHKQGLIHRDIKPANILLENGVQRVKITDFGLARAADDASLSQSGLIGGTPMYMSPEQASGEPLEYRSDLFSLGSVLYTMCTGRPPFRAGNAMAVLKRVCEDSPRPIRELNTEIPEWLVSIVAKLHSKRPSDRVPSAVALAEILGRHLAEEQRPLSSGAVATLPSRRRYWKTAAIVCAALSAVIGFLVWQGPRSQTSPSPSSTSGDSSQGASKPEAPVTDTTVQETPRQVAQKRDPDAWNRDVAEVLLKAGVFFTTCDIDGTAERPILTMAALPKAPFRVRTIRAAAVADINLVFEKLHDLDALRFISVIKCPLNDDALIQLRRLPKLKDLDILDALIRGPGLRVINELPQLASLAIGMCPITDESLEFLAGATELQRLALVAAPIQGNGLRHLAGRSSLKELKLVNTCVTDEGLERLPTIVYLEALDLTRTDVSDAGFLKLKRFPFLSRIGVAGSKVTANAVAAFRAVRPALEADAQSIPKHERETATWILENGGHVSVSTNGVDVLVTNKAEIPRSSFEIHGVIFEKMSEIRNDDIVRLAEHDRIQKVVFRHAPQLTTEGLGYIKGLCRLHSLEIGTVTKPEDWLSRIGQFPQLTDLTLAGMKLTRENLSVLRFLPALERIRFRNIVLAPGAMKQLALLPKLQTLSMGNSTLDSNWFEEVAQAGYPVGLTLFSARIVADAFPLVKRLAHIERLEFEDMAITVAELAHLEDLQGLKNLKFTRTPVTEACLAKLRGSLRNCRVELGSP